MRADSDTGDEWLAIRDEDWRRALDVQATLWRTGRMRAVGFPDLLIAAVAERKHVILMHYDSDYEQIAIVTTGGFVTIWVVAVAGRGRGGRAVPGGLGHVPVAVVGIGRGLIPGLPSRRRRGHHCPVAAGVAGVRRSVSSQPVPYPEG